MIMTIVAYKVRKNTDHMIAYHLVVGFTGQLK